MAGWQSDPVVNPNAPPAAASALAAGAAAGGAAPAWAADPVVPSSADTAGGGDASGGSPYVGGSGVIQSGPENIRDLPAAAFNTPVGAPINPRDLFMQGASGASAGLADKGAALLSAAVGTPRTLLGLDKQAPGSFYDRYHNYLDKYHGAESDFDKTHPLASTLAYGAGMVGTGAMLPGISAGASTGRAIGQTALTGAGVGAAGGLGAADDTSVGGDLASMGAGALLGTGTGLGLHALGETAIKPIVGWVARKFGGETAINDQGFHQLLTRIRQTANGGGPTAQDMLDLINHGQSLGKPLNIADVGGEPVQALAGAIARAPGEGRQIAKTAYESRVSGINSRINNDISGSVSSGPAAYDTAQALAKARSAAAGPLYDQAYAANPSVSAPEIDAVLATPAGKDALRQAATKMQNDMAPMGSGASFPGEAEVSIKAPSAGPRQPKGESLLPFLARSGGVQDEGGELSAADLSNWHVGKPYMPRLVNPQGRQLDYAREAAVEAGYLPEGGTTNDLVDAMRSEAAGHPVHKFGNAPEKGFDPGEFADLNERDQMTAAERNKNLSDLDWLNENLGPNADATTTAAQLPGFSLRTLNYVKRGLDDQIGAAQRTGARDDVRILTGLKNRLLGAMDSADATAAPNSPGLYSKARAAYSGPSSSMDAVDLGRAFNKREAGENASIVKNLTPGDREFYKLGAADTLRTTGIYADLGKSTTVRGNLQKAALQQKLRPAFGSDDEFNNFVKSSELENQMEANQRQIVGGSQTGPRVAEDAARNGGGNHLAGMVGGEMLGQAAGVPLLGGVVGRVVSGIANKIRQPSPAVDAATARMMFRPENAAGTLARALANPITGSSRPLLTAPAASLAGQKLSPLAAALIQAHLGGGQ